MRARPAAVVALALAALVLAGCWDRHETSELAIVSGVGFDWENGQYLVTAEVINPRAVSVPGQGGAQLPPMASQTALLVGHGADPSAAVADVSQLTSRHVFWTTAQAVVFGEALVRHGVGPVIDAMIRNPGMRQEPIVFVARGTARSVLAERRSGLEITTAHALSLLARNAYQDQSGGQPLRLYQLARREADPGLAPIVLGVERISAPVPNGPVFALRQSAVLSGGRLSAWMPRPLVRMVLWMTSRFVRGGFAIGCPGRGGPPTGSITVLRAGQTTRLVMSGRTLEGVDVRLTGEAGLAHTPCPMVGLPALQGEADRAVRQQAEATVAWARQHGDDVFGWGLQLWRRDPQVWRRDYASRWPTVLTHLPVHVTVRLSLQNSGLRIP